MVGASLQSFTTFKVKPLPMEKLLSGFLAWNRLSKKLQIKNTGISNVYIKR